MKRRLTALLLVPRETMLAGMGSSERTELCGPRYAPDAERHATRAGYAKSELAMGATRIDQPASRHLVRGCAESFVDAECRGAAANFLMPAYAERTFSGSHGINSRRE